MNDMHGIRNAYQNHPSGHAISNNVEHFAGFLYTVDLFIISFCAWLNGFCRKISLRRAALFGRKLKCNQN